MFSKALTRVLKNAYVDLRLTEVLESKTFCQQFWLPRVVVRRRLCCEVEVNRPYTRQRRLVMASERQQIRRLVRGILDAWG